MTTLNYLKQAFEGSNKIDIYLRRKRNLSNRIGALGFPSTYTTGIVKETKPDVPSLDVQSDASTDDNPECTPETSPEPGLPTPGPGGPLQLLGPPALNEDSDTEPNAEPENTLIYLTLDGREVGAVFDKGEIPDAERPSITLHTVSLKDGLAQSSEGREAPVPEIFLLKDGPARMPVFHECEVPEPEIAIIGESDASGRCARPVTPGGGHTGKC